MRYRRCPDAPLRNSELPSLVVQATRAGWPLEITWVKSGDHGNSHYRNSWTST